jgi:hypothetical protein
MKEYEQMISVLQAKIVELEIITKQQSEIIIQQAIRFVDLEKCVNKKGNNSSKHSVPVAN